MQEDSAYETCSVNHCPRPSTTTEHGRVGHWYFTVFYCDEHSRELREGVPIGPVGLDPSHLRIEPVGSDTPDAGRGRMPGIA